MKNRKLKTIGGIGGMGPRATVRFEQCIIENSNASSDKDFPSIITYNNSQIEDRTLSLQENGGKKYVQDVISTGKALIGMGADFLVMPCNTAHARYDEIQHALSRPLINMVERVLRVVEKKQGKVAILGTTGILKERVYERGCIVRKIPYHIHREQDQRMIMEAIYLIKRGEFSGAVKSIQPVIRWLEKNGIKRAILACTELPLIKDMIKTDVELIDSVDILAKAT